MDSLTSFVEKIVPSALMALDPFSKLIWLSVWGFISVFYFIPFDVLFFLNPWYCFGYWSFIVNSEVIYDLFTFQHCFGCLGFLEIKRKKLYGCVQAYATAACGSQRMTFGSRFFGLSSVVIRLAQQTLTWRTIFLSPLLFYLVLFWLSGVPWGFIWILRWLLCSHQWIFNRLF